ncbi:UbiA prenyltransferase family protein [Adhaeribacter pallidiroseus]|uniref:4-hydroxybenzoate polyprenyltransferase n=1 Tax=Adhaeribacter pallidiroseus TaxID=2072847 RepID=A0A369QS07_9BACT|nr:hypothetical protein [Adhaeribacter pallidiroseus]RDC66017.1 hypothetical protein AHMF7616_04648 [Adhaeribacter pallidiroseus]
MRVLSFFRIIGRGILFSNLFIATCAFGLVCQTYLLLHLPVRYWQACLAFLATFFIYNLDGLLPYKFNQNVIVSERKVWLMNNRSVLLFSIGLAAIMAVFLFIRYGQPHYFWLIGHLVAISFFYSWRIIPQKNGVSIPLRNIPLLKIFLIAYVWSCVTVILPLLALAVDNFLLSTNVGILFMRRFTFLFALTLVFDIRDYKKDKITHTLTFPGLVGVFSTKVFASLLLLVFAVLTWYSESGSALIHLELSAGLALLVVWFSTENRSDYYFLIFADGMMLVQSILVLMATH